jgi:polyisoprenoid-binding protein YceI
MMRTPWICGPGLVLVLVSAHAREFVLHCDAGQTKAEWTLSDPLHTVKGDSKSKQCALRYDTVSGKVEGEIVFDATSGESGNSSRDHKMHKDVLESQKYPDIRFHPDHVDGQLATAGPSTLEVHGAFSIHGSDHEITVPVTIMVDAPTWTANAHFSVPYVKWGMKNPSLLFLHVGDEVGINFHGAGPVVMNEKP